MNILDDVCPISEFRDHAKALVTKVKEDNRPLIITQHGKSSAVLISAEYYQDMLDRIKILTDIAESEEEIANGGGIEHEEYFAKLMAKYI